MMETINTLTTGAGSDTSHAMPGPDLSWLDVECEFEARANQELESRAQLGTASVSCGIDVNISNALLDATAFLNSDGFGVLTDFATRGVSTADENKGKEDVAPLCEAGGGASELPLDALHSAMIANATRNDSVLGSDAMPSSALSPEELDANTLPTDDIQDNVLNPRDVTLTQPQVTSQAAQTHFRLHPVAHSTAHPQALKSHLNTRSVVAKTEIAQKSPRLPRTPKAPKASRDTRAPKEPRKRKPRVNTKGLGAAAAVTSVKDTEDPKSATAGVKKYKGKARNVRCSWYLLLSFNARMKDD